MTSSTALRWNGVSYLSVMSTLTPTSPPLPFPLLSSLDTYPRNRYWILAAHPHESLLAAGHDGGMTVFKLERERLPLDVAALGSVSSAASSPISRLYYIKDRYLRVMELATNKDVPLHPLRRGVSPGLGGGPKALMYNHYCAGLSSSGTSTTASTAGGEHHLLIFTDAEGGSYELLIFGDSAGSTSTGGAGAASSAEPTDSKKGTCVAAAFLARNRFAVLDKQRYAPLFS